MTAPRPLNLAPLLDASIYAGELRADEEDRHARALTAKAVDQARKAATVYTRDALDVDVDPAGWRHLETLERKGSPDAIVAYPFDTYRGLSLVFRPAGYTDGGHRLTVALLDDVAGWIMSTVRITELADLEPAVTDALNRTPTSDDAGGLAPAADEADPEGPAVTVTGDTWAAILRTALTAILDGQT